MTKLALGTVQFGLDYGISNIKGQVSFEEVSKILKLAKESSIHTIDTANGYGNSEKVLGNAGVNDFKIVTKTAPLCLGVNNVLKPFHQSLKDLNVSNVDGILIHNIDDTKDIEFDILYKAFKKLKQEKLINKIGFSTYTPEQVEFLLENFDFDLIQVPFNVFDTRLVEGGQLKILKKKNIEIHARSVFLQGVLLNFDSLSDYFLIWEPQFKRYQEMVREKKLSLLEYALNFVLNNKELDKILVGIDSVKQLTEIINAYKLNVDLKAFKIDDIKLLNPSNWSLNQ